MTDKEYKQKKRECWEEFIGTDGIPTERLRACLDFAFDRAYALGKEKETITQEDVEKASKEFAKSIIDSFGLNGVPCGISDIRSMIADGFKSGASFALGKQEKDADTVISGWACRDNNSLNAHVLIGDKPKRNGFNFWENKSADYITLPTELFHDLTWESDPEEVELIIKRKKNG